MNEYWQTFIASMLASVVVSLAVSCLIHTIFRARDARRYRRLRREWTANMSDFRITEPKGGWNRITIRRSEGIQ